MASNTSIKPADEGNLIGLFKTVQERILRNSENMLPARVVNFDRAKNRVTVQPMIRLLGTGGADISRAEIPSIPVYNPSGGGFGVYFPLVAGNLGWIQANDRDISLFLQSYQESKPNTTRKHLFADAVFYPDMMTGYSIDEEDTENLTIQNSDASVKVTLSNDTVKVKAVNIINECINYTVNADEAIINATDTIINATTLTHNGVNIGSTHGHSQANDSDGNSEADTSTPITIP